jgi:hypothetical protein
MSDRKVLKVRDAPAPDDPPLRIGDTVRLNSGSPLLVVLEAGHSLLVVEHSGERLTLAREAVRRFRRVV